MAPLKIVIVGAGVGGLAAAIGLARNGHQVTIYERLTSTTDVGYAFRITANSDRCLKYLGIDTCAGGAVAANSTRILNAEGETITRFTENSDGEKAKRGTSVFAYRVCSHELEHNDVADILAATIGSATDGYGPPHWCDGEQWCESRICGYYKYDSNSRWRKDHFGRLDHCCGWSTCMRNSLQLLPAYLFG